MATSFGLSCTVALSLSDEYTQITNNMPVCCLSASVDEGPVAVISVNDVQVSYVVRIFDMKVSSSIIVVTINVLENGRKTSPFADTSLCSEKLVS